MRKLMLVGALAMLSGAAASAQDRAPAGDQKPAVQIDNEVTVTGCLMRESDYRAMHDAGRGGVLGSGVGVGDEFVLVNARPTRNTPEGRRGGRRGDTVTGRPMEAVGTAGGPGGRSYTLTGDAEKNLVSDIGRMVQVVGKVDVAGRATGGDVVAVEDLPRLTISVWHPVGDFCPSRQPR
jgi:hypothetical protein